MILIILDVIGCISGIIGAILVGRVNKLGYIFFMSCNTAYFALGLLQGYYGLVLVSVVMFGIDVYYYIKWKHRDEELLMELKDIIDAHAQSSKLTKNDDWNKLTEAKKKKIIENLNQSY